ncbi:hypothetical protein QBC41DRAFT_325469, partial [Cercophora samala]
MKIQGYVVRNGGDEHKAAEQTLDNHHKADAGHRPSLHLPQPKLRFPSSALNSERLRSLSMDLTFEHALSKMDTTLNIPAHELFMALRGFDEDGNLVIDPDFTEFSIHEEPSESGLVVLGKAFLSQYLLSVDYDHRKWTLSGPIGNNPVRQSPAVSLRERMGQAMLYQPCLVAAPLTFTVVGAVLVRYDLVVPAINWLGSPQSALTAVVWRIYERRFSPVGAGFRVGDSGKRHRTPAPYIWYLIA